MSGAVTSMSESAEQRQRAAQHVEVAVLVAQRRQQRREHVAVGVPRQAVDRGAPHPPVVVAQRRSNSGSSIASARRPVRRGLAHGRVGAAQRRPARARGPAAP